MQRVEKLSDIKLKKTDTLQPSTIKEMQQALDLRLKHKSLYPETFNQRTSVGQFGFLAETEIYDVKTDRYKMSVSFSDINSAPCHGTYFRLIKHNISDGMINFHMNNYWPQKDKKLLWWLIKELYADVQENLVVVVDHQKVRNFPVAVVLTNIRDQDMLLFGNFLIATRLVSAWNCSPAWSLFQKAGFTPELSLLLALQCYWIASNGYQTSGLNYEGRLQNRGINPGDQPFSGTVSLKALESRKYNEKETRNKLSDGQTGQYSNFIWSTAGLKPYVYPALISILEAYNTTGKISKEFVEAAQKWYKERELV